MGRTCEPPSNLDACADDGGIAHATTVSVDGRAMLIAGVSGSGKSSLALQMIALGAGLVSDDRTILTPSPEGLPLASAPPAIAGLIEARGIGVLKLPEAGPARVVAVIDLDRTETERVPEARRIRLCGAEVPYLHKVETGSFPAALLVYLRSGRLEP